MLINIKTEITLISWQTVSLPCLVGKVSVKTQ